MAKVDSQDWRDRYDQLMKRYNEMNKERTPVLEDYENTINQTLDALVGETIPGIQDLMRTSRQMTEIANEDYLPAAQDYIRDAQEYDTEERRGLASQAAISDVMSAGEASRQSAIAKLESYGIDPSMTRGAALDQNVRLQSALEAVRQGREAATGVEERGREFRRDALTVGSGIQQGALNTASTAAGIGQGAIQSGLQTATTFGNIFGTPVSTLAANKDLLDASWNAKATETQLKLANKGGSGLAGIGQAVGTVGGAVVGAYFGGPAGAAVGAQAGGALGGAAGGAAGGGGGGGGSMPAIY